MSVTDLLGHAVTALGGTDRAGQVQMAEAVAHAFESGEHLAVQAGTGTGKSLAYLVPAVARAVSQGVPVVVSTATLALQAQIVDRELPRLADAVAELDALAGFEKSGHFFFNEPLGRGYDDGIVGLGDDHRHLPAGHGADVGRLVIAVIGVEWHR